MRYYTHRIYSFNSLFLFLCEKYVKYYLAISGLIAISGLMATINGLMATISGLMATISGLMATISGLMATISDPMAISSA